MLMIKDNDIGDDSDSSDRISSTDQQFKQRVSVPWVVGPSTSETTQGSATSVK